jgi:hypothetical protein
LFARNDDVSADRRDGIGQAIGPARRGDILVGAIGISGDGVDRAAVAERTVRSVLVDADGVRDLTVRGGRRSRRPGGAEKPDAATP